MESGLNDHLLAQYKLIKVSPIEQPKEASIYYSMAAFVEDNTTFDQINMNYFFYLFCFTILSQLLLLCIKMIETVADLFVCSLYEEDQAKQNKQTKEC